MGYIGQDKSTDYEQESNAKALSEAHMIRKDGKKHAHALKHLKKQAKHSSHAAETHAFESKYGGTVQPPAMGAASNGTGSTGEAEGAAVAGE
jgi:hypothetical protein